MNDETPTPSRRRGRPPKVITIPNVLITPSVAVTDASILAPPQEPELHTQAISVAPVPIQAPTVPSPLPAVVADDVDLRETPAMAARHSMGSDPDVRGVSEDKLTIAAGENPALPSISGSDSKVRGVSDGYLPVDAGKVAAYPALPEQFVPIAQNIERSHPKRQVAGESPAGDATSQALPEQERIPEPGPTLVPLTEVAPAAPVQTNWTPVQVGDVVQINSNRSKHYGALFIIGDIRNHRVHGYQIGLGGKLEYFTVNEDECILVGPSTKGQVRSMSGCSAKWKAENR